LIMLGGCMFTTPRARIADGPTPRMTSTCSVIAITDLECWCSLGADGSASGSAEVVNMQPPAALIKRGVTSLPCIGDGRQSGTSASPRSSMRPGSGGRRRPCAAPERRLCAHRPRQRKGGHSDIGRGSSHNAARLRTALAATNTPKARRPGRRSRRHGRPAPTHGAQAAVKYQRVAEKFVPRDNH